jgi:hypothetical protein
MSKVKGLGTAEKPWELKTPPRTAEYQAYKDERADPPGARRAGWENAAPV